MYLFENFILLGTNLSFYMSKIQPLFKIKVFYIVKNQYTVIEM